MQSRKMSLLETLANVGVSYLISIITQAMVFPLFDIKMNLSENMQISGIFTVIGLIRTYVIRRIFNSQESA